MLYIIMRFCIYRYISIKLKKLKERTKESS